MEGRIRLHKHCQSYRHLRQRIKNSWISRSTRLEWRFWHHNLLLVISSHFREHSIGVVQRWIAKLFVTFSCVCSTFIRSVENTGCRFGVVFSKEKKNILNYILNPKSALFHSFFLWYLWHARITEPRLHKEIFFSFNFSYIDRCLHHLIYFNDFSFE